MRPILDHEIPLMRKIMKRKQGRLISTCKRFYGQQYSMYHMNLYSCTDSIQSIGSYRHVDFFFADHIFPISIQSYRFRTIHKFVPYGVHIARTNGRTTGICSNRSVEFCREDKARVFDQEGCGFPLLVHLHNQVRLNLFL